MAGRRLILWSTKWAASAKRWPFSTIWRKLRSRHLQVRLEYLGHIPVDEKLKRATQLCRPVIEAFPAAQASYAIREIAQGLMRVPRVSDEGHDVLGSVMQRMMRQSRPANNTMAIT